MKFLLALVLLFFPQQSDAEKKIRDRQATLSTALKSAKTPSETMDVADALFDLSEEAFKENLYDLSLKLLDQAQKIAVAAKDTAFVSRVSGRANEIKDIQKEFAKARAALKTVIDSPEDADANLLVGKFLCFYKNEWELGIINLSKGSDKPLKALADKEISDPKESKGLVDIGDGWWDFGESKKDTRIRHRAAYWYERAWDSLDKVSRIRVRDRLKTALSNPKGGAALDMPYGWVRQGGDIKTTHLDDRYSRTGRYSMYLDYPVTVGQQFFQSSMPVTAGTAYDVSAWVITEGSGKGVLMIHLIGDKPEQGPFTELPIDRPFWSKVSLKFSPPAGVSKIEVILVGYGPGGHAWVDDVSVKKSGEDRNLINNGSFEEK